MRNFFLWIINCFFFIGPIFSQFVSNQAHFGTANVEVEPGSLELSDNNFLLYCSTSLGINGNKTSPSYGGTDFWLMKLDETNSILWQTSFGGNGYDDIMDVEETSEGELLVVGRSNSTISGNKTSVNIGLNDFWMLKLNSLGEILWQKTFGTLNEEYISDILIVSDSNYLLVGNSASNIGGDKTENSFGSMDYWIVSIDSSGTILWDKTIGGSEYENVGTAKFNEMSNKIYIGGQSQSNISGIKDENNFGDDDIWIVSLDLAGQILEQKTVGGTNWEFYGDLLINNSGQIFVLGNSESSNSGTKFSTNFGMSDIWLQILDANLNVITDYSFGGEDVDGCMGGVLNSDGNILFHGFSRSGISGMKNEVSKGLGDNWIIVVNPNNGNLEWQKTIGGNLFEHPLNVYESTSSYKVIGMSESGISGDKTVPTFGDYDFWLFDLDKSVGISELNNMDLYVFPNPSNGIFKMNNDFKCSMRVTDSRGLTILTLNSQPNTQIDLSQFSNGIYFLEMKDSNGQISMERLVKN